MELFLLHITIGSALGFFAAIMLSEKLESTYTKVRNRVTNLIKKLFRRK
jgi:uncharacterized membrane protein